MFSKFKSFAKVVESLARDAVYRFSNVWSGTMPWAELLLRVQYIRDLYAKHKVPLKTGEGLTLALDEAEALARGTKSPAVPTPAVLRAMVHQAHVVWALADNLKVCVDGGLDVIDYLKRINTGSTNFGEPRTDAQASPREIHFKDFECELFVAASLLRGGRRPSFLPEPNDPSGELDVDGLRVEVKHPDATGSVQRHMEDFHGQLKKRKLYGVFVVGLEDAFQLADVSDFKSTDEFDRWKTAKMDAIEEFGRGMLKRAARLPRILATVQTTTEVRHIDGASNLVRLSNGCLLDIRNGVPPTSFEAAERVIRVFNPKFRRYSEIKELVEGPTTNVEDGATTGEVAASPSSPPASAPPKSTPD